MYSKNSISTKLFNIFNYTIVLIVSVSTLLPLIAVISGSFTAEKELLINGVGFIPKVFSLEAYKLLFLNRAEIINSYKITIFITLVGSGLSILFTSMIGYITALKSLRLRNHISFMIYFTMLFNGGMIPWYLLIVKYLGLKNTIWALILPMLINPYFVFLMRNYFRGIPDELRESGIIDGATEFYVFIKIILPVSKPLLATIGLFYMLAYWNDFYHALFFIDNKKLIPLQFHLYRMVSNINFVANQSADKDIGAINVILPSEGIRFATTVVTIGPIIFLYPFLQKYFIKGILIGSIKG